MENPELVGIRIGDITYWVPPNEVDAYMAFLDNRAPHPSRLIR